MSLKKQDITSTVHFFGSKEITQESMVKSIYISVDCFRFRNVFIVKGKERWL